MFLDIGTGELLALLVLAAVLLGPEKLPELAKKAGRVIGYLRKVANTATDQIKTELGPEFADLKVEDLKPANLVTKILPNDAQSELDSMRAELESLRASLTDLKKDTAAQVSVLTDQVDETVSAAVTSAKAASEAVADSSSSKSIAKPFWMTT
ncbi:MAG: twin-arginine translocase TatA/TatE family subunit [Propionibacteriaceae bacterium]|nr:twin-arginine translocase TatA/TatE family subunit [Propionibacteriaceae bacterium]